MKTMRFWASMALLCVLPHSQLSAQDEEGVPVCVGSDRVLRHTPEGECPRGQKLFRLAEVEPEDIAKEAVDTMQGPEQPRRPDAPRSEPAGSEVLKRLEVLTARVTALEAAPASVQSTAPPPAPVRSGRSVGNRVTAPFEVVDRAGRSILLVTEAKAPSTLGRIVIGQGTGNGNYGVVFRNPQGQVVAGMGAGTDGSGALLLNDADGKRTMQATGLEGFKILRPSGSMAFSAGQGGDGGALALYDGSGALMIWAGVDEGVGTVKAGPNYRCAGFAGPTVAVIRPDCIRGLR